jgi:hypothetical protein
VGRASRFCVIFNQCIIIGEEDKRITQKKSGHVLPCQGLELGLGLGKTTRVRVRVRLTVTASVRVRVVVKVRVRVRVRG